MLGTIDAIYDGRPADAQVMPNTLDFFAFLRRPEQHSRYATHFAVSAPYYGSPATLTGGTPSTPNLASRGSPARTSVSASDVDARDAACFEEHGASRRASRRVAAADLSVRSLLGAPAAAPRHAQPRIRRHDPYAAPQAARQQPPRAVFGIRHQALVPLCRFVALPREVAPVSPAVPTPHALRVTQATYELSAGQLRWLTKQVTGVAPSGAASEGAGSFTLYFASKADMTRARRLHRAVLFDLSGVWAPRDDAERAAVREYMASREFELRGDRLPRDFVVVLNKQARRTTSHPSCTSQAAPPQC